VKLITIYATIRIKTLYSRADEFHLVEFLSNKIWVFKKELDCGEVNKKRRQIKKILIKKIVFLNPCFNNSREKIKPSCFV
jgi:hypothetical protein